MDLLKSLTWRYATKKYSDKKVSEKDLQTILEAINLSASSAGMQPYRIFVIENPEIRKELGADSFNPQISEASHLLVFAAYSSINAKHIDDYMQLVAHVRDTPTESLTDFKHSLEKYLLASTDDENFQWATRQAYIALGTALIAAADLRIDATPMEGFNGAAFDTALALPEKGLKSVVLLALGYRDEEKDMFARLKKVRLPQEEFVTEVA